MNQPLITTLSREQMLKMIAELQEAKRMLDVDRLQLMYHPDCTIEYVALGLKNKGKAAIRPATALFRSVFAEFNLRSQLVTASEDSLIIKGELELLIAGNYNGYKPNGKVAVVRAFATFQFTEQLVSLESYFWDSLAFCSQSGLPLDALKTQKQSTL